MWPEAARPSRGSLRELPEVSGKVWSLVAPIRNSQVVGAGIGGGLCLRGANVLTSDYCAPALFDRCDLVPAVFLKKVRASP
jgi:hypothetical protein